MRLKKQCHQKETVIIEEQEMETESDQCGQQKTSEMASDPNPQPECTECKNFRIAINGDHPPCVE